MRAQQGTLTMPPERMWLQVRLRLWRTARRCLKHTQLWRSASACGQQCMRHMQQTVLPRRV